MEGGDLDVLPPAFDTEDGQKRQSGTGIKELVIIAVLIFVFACIGFYVSRDSSVNMLLTVFFTYSALLGFVVI